MGIETAAAIGGIAAAGAGTAGSIVGAVRGSSNEVSPVFPGMNQDYLKGLKSSGIGPTSMGTMTEMAKTGMPTDVGPMFEALKASQSKAVATGRANILEQFGSSGLRYSTPMLNALSDYESQIQSNYGSILSNYVFQAMEAARGRQMGASQVGLQAWGTPALALKGNVSNPGLGIANIGQSLIGLQTAIKQWPQS